MFGSISFFDIFLLAIALYVLVGGIRGKGRLFQVENIKEGMEEKFRSVSRRLYIWLGVVMLVNSGSSLARGLLYSPPAADAAGAAAAWTPKYDMGGFSFLSVTVLNWITYIAMGITLALLVVLVILMRRYVDKEAAKSQAAERARTGRAPGRAMPTSAFEFDDLERESDGSGRG